MNRHLTNGFFDLSDCDDGEEISQSVIEFSQILTILHSSIVSTLVNGEQTAISRQTDGNLPNQRQLAGKEAE